MSTVEGPSDWDYEAEPEGPVFDALCDQLDRIDTRHDFVAFLGALRDDLRAYPQSWENGTLPDYLDVLAVVTESLEQRFTNLGETLPEQPTWRLVADILLTARNYE